MAVSKHKRAPTAGLVTAVNQLPLAGKDGVAVLHLPLGLSSVRQINDSLRTEVGCISWAASDTSERKICPSQAKIYQKSKLINTEIKSKT